MLKKAFTDWHFSLKSFISSQLENILLSFVDYGNTGEYITEKILCVLFHILCLLFCCTLIFFFVFYQQITLTKNYVILFYYIPSFGLLLCIFYITLFTQTRYTHVHFLTCLVLPLLASLINSMVSYLFVPFCFSTFLGILCFLDF